MSSALAQFGSPDQATTLATDAFMRRGASPKFAVGGTAAGASEAQGGKSASPDADLRGIVGEFVGNVFYGTLLRQMEQTTIKGKYMHGGRGEEVFQSQLHMEYAKRLGRAPGDPIADRIYESMTRGKRAAEARSSDTNTSAANPGVGAGSAEAAVNRSTAAQ